MLAVTTKELKTFMNLLLGGEAFDSFVLCEATVTVGATYTIDGHINKAFYEPEDPHAAEDNLYQYWSDIRPIVFQMIKGTRLPLGIKIVFSFSPEDIDAFVQQNHLPVSADQISGLYLNIRYEQEQLKITTGTALRQFTMDRTIDLMWDEYVLHFLTGLGIAPEEIA